MSIFGELYDKGKELAGEGIGDLATAASDGLNDVGLHGAAQWVEAEGGKLSTNLSGDAAELQLGQTTDPARLVLGDPAAIRASASRLKDFSSAFGETATGMRGLDTGHWTGAAADAFRGKFAPHPGQWQDAADATSTASAALASYAAAVESAQGQARQAIDLYQQGQQATATATAAYNQQVSTYNSAAQAYNAALAARQNPGTRLVKPGAFTDPGAALREQAQQLLSTARASRNAAGSSAADKVTSATSQAPAEPSFWSQIKADLSDGAQAGVLAGMSFGAGVVYGAAGIVSFVRLVNPEDPSNQQNPGEYKAGLSGILADLAHDVTDPKSLAENIVGSGWDSNPWQALGKLVPGVALTLLTDGSGAAAAGVSLGDGAEEAIPLRIVEISGPNEFNPASLEGLTPAEVRASIPSDWTQSESNSGGGEVFRDPDNFGRQIRIMPGYPAGSRPALITTGPYAVVSQNGTRVKIPLFGNPALP